MKASDISSQMKASEISSQKIMDSIRPLPEAGKQEQSSAERALLPPEMEAAGLSLFMDGDALTLTDGTNTLCGDFTRMKKRLREANLRQELLVKAARIKSLQDDRKPVILDATAGLGEDSMLLAAAGHQVELYERDPVIAALLADALRRAAEDPALAEAAGRMHLHSGDSEAAMREYARRMHRETTKKSEICLQNKEDVKAEEKCAETQKRDSDQAGMNGDESADAELTAIDIIYLDPMFPGRHKSGLVGKKFQLLQQLESPCADEEELMQAALAAEPAKIIIKRPVKGPYLAGRKPSYSLMGKTVRYDCLVFPENHHV